MGIKESLFTENRILLAGNGISDAQKINWINMLSYVQDEIYHLPEFTNSKKLEDLSSISPTLFFESLSKRSTDQNKTEKELRTLVKKYVSDKSNFVHKLWNLYNVILTTNFDNNLVISKTDVLENDENPKEKQLTYEESPLYRRLDFTYDKKQKSIFFVHGYFKNPETICLGYDQYTDNLKKIENYVVQNYSEKNYKKKNNNKTVSWVDYFFKNNTTIDILGFSLCNEEIDFWWILIYRKKCLHRIKNNVINYYDLPENCVQDEETKSKQTAKHKIFESFGINVIQIENAQKYNSDFYSLCLKKIKFDIENNNNCVGEKND